MNNESTNNYGKRPLWQWALMYAIIGLVVYGLIYYFVLGRRGGSTYNTIPTSSPGTTLESSPSATTEVSQDTIILTADGFTPATLTVKTGTKVTWTNQSGKKASVNSSPHPTHTDYPPLNMGNLSNGGSLFLTFDKPGTYKYHNHLNPSQFGTVIVQ